LLSFLTEKQNIYFACKELFQNAKRLSPRVSPLVVQTSLHDSKNSVWKHFFDLNFLYFYDLRYSRCLMVSHARVLALSLTSRLKYLRSSVKVKNVLHRVQ
jgi:hypothetical protein